MKKILLQLDTDLHPSVFDAVSALDATDCVLLRHGQVTPENVVGLVHGCMFTRSPKDLRNTAIFIGGSDIETAESVLQTVRRIQWKPRDVSVMFDPNGCNTTAASVIYNMAFGASMKGERFVVVSGTGPVGQRAAGLALKQGASVLITSRNIEKARKAAAAIEDRFGGKCEAAVMREEKDLAPVLDGARFALCCGAAGVELIPEKIWRFHPTLRVAADVNAVPPFGLAGIEASWRGHEIDGKLVYGAIGIGWLKMRMHHLAISKLFESQGLLMDAEGILDLAESAARS